MTKLSEINENIEMIFQAIEDNDGELTPELEQMLLISQDELEEKLHNYSDYILQYEGDITTVKNKIKMLQTRIKSKESRIDRLKQHAIFAINTYGKLNKNNNHYIEFPDLKVAVRPSHSVEFNEDRIEWLIELFRNYTRELYVNGLLETGNELDIEGILDGINAIGKADYEEKCPDGQYDPFTIEDLKYLRINLNFNVSFVELIMHDFLLKAHWSVGSDISAIESAKDKKYMKIGLDISPEKCTLAHIQTKDNLTIK